MSIFKKFFNQISGGAKDVPFGELVIDDGKPLWDRAVRIAEAVNRARNPETYLAFRDDQLRYMDMVFKSALAADDILKPLWQATEKHLSELKQLAQAGDEALLKNAPQLQAAAADLSLRRTETFNILQSKMDPLRALTKTFILLAEAEKQMPTLPAADKKHITQAITLLSQQDTHMMRQAADLTVTGNDAEKAITKARDAEIARANQQREAVAAMEAGNRKVKFNEYLSTGLVTGGAIKAPKTARFTRKPKHVQGILS